tara:strand:+ start:56 stop:634 length:579 start_codon:yes stop_codon:yes gene_type:complete
MEIKKLTSNKGNIIDGPLLIEPKVFLDTRGFFFESWNQSTFDINTNEKIIFSQDNHSCSKKGVLRGLHYQIPPKPQEKLVRCISGEIFDVAVDLRKSSETFGEWISVKLNNSNKLMFWIPVGFAHGFLSLRENSEVIYKASSNYSKELERSIIWNDPTINIKWPLQIINFENPTLSNKDANAPLLNEVEIFV